MSVTDLLNANFVLEEVDSPINGHIQVIKDLVWGIQIKIGGLTQSGGVVKSVWKTTLRYLLSKGFVPKKCLILGLGGGSAAQLVRNFWKESEIVGVDVDPIIVQLGKKYLKLDAVLAKMVIDDGLSFCRSSLEKGVIYDLILVDMYVGDKYPQKFESIDFVKLVEKLLSPKGVVIFNRLYYGEKRIDAYIFSKILESVFKNVSYIYPEANIMFVCSNFDSSNK